MFITGRLKSSVDNILHREVEKNKILREKLLLIGFALELAKVSTNNLEKALQDLLEGQRPDILIAAFSHIEKLKLQLLQISNCAGENKQQLFQGGVVTYPIAPNISQSNAETPRHIEYMHT